LNSKPIGAERYNYGYLIRKVQNTGNFKEDWKLVHHLVWLEAGREIPPDHIVYFKDRNPRNFTLDNLGIATKSENLKRLSAMNKGTPSKKRKPLGSEILNNDGYLLRKVSNTGIPHKDWQPAHRCVWLEAGREIPPGYVVTLKDGNRQNISLENLVLMPRAELARKSALLNNAKFKNFGFKKGYTPSNKLPLGSERYEKSGFLIRKIQDTGDYYQDWRYVHHLIWREAGREIPPGYFLFFKDGDKTNLELKNLELVSKSELFKRLRDIYPTEFYMLVRDLNKLSKEIEQRKKEEGEKQEAQ